jgi:hypothetical protein
MAEKSGMGPDISIPASADMVNHPEHYNAGEIECIDAIRAALGDNFRYFLQGTVIKYMWRLEHKGKPCQDASKGEWYLKRLIKELEGTDAP